MTSWMLTKQLPGQSVDVGDCALGLFSSGYFRFIDSASQKPRVDLVPVDMTCGGGLRLYATPIHAGNEVVGSMLDGHALHEIIWNDEWDPIDYRCPDVLPETKNDMQIVNIVEHDLGGTLAFPSNNSFSCTTAVPRQ